MKEALTLTLDSIHQRMLASKVALSLSSAVTVPLDSDQYRLRDFKARNGDSNAAMAGEQLVGPEQLRDLGSGIEALRNGIFKFGKPVDSKGTFAIEDADVTLKADIEDKGRVNQKVEINVLGYPSMDIDFNFSGGYSLRIQFGEYEEDEEYADYYHTDYITEMTMTEYKIISNFLGVGRDIINERT